jgi:cobyrinic acid a,c-diamide synthase
MYLAQELRTAEGKSYPLVGLLPTATRMLARLRSLGYVEVTLQDNSLWGPRGTTFRGHEFHYSELTEPVAADSGWRSVYSVQQRDGQPPELEGFQKGRILASYVHAHFASRPQLIEHFVANCGAHR